MSSPLCVSVSVSLLIRTPDIGFRAQLTQHDFILTRLLWRPYFQIRPHPQGLGLKLISQPIACSNKPGEGSRRCLPEGPLQGSDTCFSPPLLSPGMVRCLCFANLLGEERYYIVILICVFLLTCEVPNFAYICSPCTSLFMGLPSTFPLVICLLLIDFQKFFSLIPMLYGLHILQISSNLWLAFSLNLQERVLNGIFKILMSKSSIFSSTV